MIKLDWDKISWSTMEKRVEYIKSYHSFNEIIIFSSPSLDGFHAEIKCRYVCSQAQIFNYRYEFQDDVNRLVRDILFYNKHRHLSTRDILFDFKEKTKMGVTMIFERIQLFKYQRLKYNDVWLKIPQQKNTQICIARQ